MNGQYIIVIFFRNYYLIILWNDKSTIYLKIIGNCVFLQNFTSIP